MMRSNSVMGLQMPPRPSYLTPYNCILPLTVGAFNIFLSRPLDRGLGKAKAPRTKSRRRWAATKPVATHRPEAVIIIGPGAMKRLLRNLVAETAVSGDLSLLRRTRYRATWGREHSAPVQGVCILLGIARLRVICEVLVNRWED